MKKRTFIKYVAGNASLLCLCPTLPSLALRGALEKWKEEGLDYSGFSKKEIIPAPDDPKEWEAFRKALLAWRTEERKKINYWDKLYQDVNFKWASSAFNNYFLGIYDGAFYDPQANRYTLEKFVDDAIRDFGRLDIVLLDSHYPCIGLDNRNQFDYYRDMPGGLEGLKKICDFFHSKDIKVLLDYWPGDIGTRRENVSDIDTLVNIVKAIDADGLFLDTISSAGPEFREKLDAIKPGIVLEGEVALPVMNIRDQHLSWAQWFKDSQAPGILRNKWFEPRHIQHGTRRWGTDHIQELHTAWMNGSGVLIWESIFGQWNGWNKRDKSILKAISPIQKRYAELFTEGEWIPLVDPNPVKNIYANLWIKEGIRLWTLVNRSDETVSGKILHIELKTDETFYDLIRGQKVKPQVKPHSDSNRQGLISGIIGARGVACFLAIDKRLVDKDFTAFLKAQAAIYKNADYDPSVIRRTAQLKPFIRTEKQNNALQGMIAIPSVKKKMHVDFRVREVGYYQSFDESFASFSWPKLHHIKTIEKEIDIRRFAMDETPVTNKQYEIFLKASGYRPAESTNFLKHWENGKIPAGKDNHPVVYVDLDDARAYALWAGKRLPTEEEWQWAAQGDSDNKYPWGNEMKEGFCNSGKGNGSTPVYSYPEGKSTWGCYDMCGNVWELTESEYDDGRNRFCILKGGSYYQAKGSEWYFDGGPLPINFAAKQLLMYPGIDRCATIGFRCAVDLV